MVLAWCGASLLVAVIHHRMRSAQPRLGADVSTFLARFEAELARSHRDVRFLGMLPGQLVAILEVRGQETPVPIQGLVRHVTAFPDSLGVVVDQLIDEIEEIGLEQPDDREFAEIVADLMPQVRSVAWVERHGRFGDSTLVSRPLTDDLCVTYVIDGPHCMTFVCRAHLRRWGRTDDDLHNLALANLRARCGGTPDPADEPGLYATGDGYDAARMLLLDPERCDGLLVAVPDRDVLWVGAEENADLASIMAVNEDLNRRASHPVSPSVFRIRSGGLERVSGS